jgi:hypothetical protein
MKKKNILWRNIYNTDEKWIQMGDGRKETCTRYFFARDDKMKYKLQSDELQLVTIIDIICADCTANIGPCFVFPGVRATVIAERSVLAGDPKFNILQRLLLLNFTPSRGS